MPPQSYRIPSTESGDVLAVITDALETGHDRNGAIVQRALDPTRGHVDDPGATVRAISDQARLGSCVGTSLVAVVVDGHGQQCHRHAFPRSQQHVHLAAGRVGGDLMGQVDELVGGVPHRGDHHNDIVAGPLGVRDPAGDPLDRRRIRHRRSAELLHDQRHAAASLASRHIVPRCAQCRRPANGPRRFCQVTDRRPAKARPRVTSSANSRSPPTGRPLARRETVIPKSANMRAR